MASPGQVVDERPRLVQFSAKVTQAQGYWLDSRARILGRSSAEVLRLLLDEAMARDNGAVFHGTQPARKPSR